MTETKYRIPGLMIITLPYSVTEIIKSLLSKYDEAIMSELINNPGFHDDQTMRKTKKFNKFWLRVFKGTLVIRGAYQIYLNNRDEFKNAWRQK